MPEIDAVYLWVDGADVNAGNCAHEESVAPYRFADHGELQWSLRSLDTYAPWIRTIHIVTNGQVPAWLDTRDPRINMVTHEDIFPDPSCLPTYNSHAIELFLDRIPNLAEHFLAMNDDFFLGAPFSETDFFPQDGIARFFSSPTWIPKEPSAVWEHAVHNADVLLSSMFSAACRKRPAHQVRPLCKTVVRECREQFSHTILHAANNRYRDTSDISFAWILAPWYALLTGRAVPKYVSELCITIYDDPEKTRQQLEVLEERHPALFCMNDFTVTPATESWNLVTGYMRQRFPAPIAAGQ